VKEDTSGEPLAVHRCPSATTHRVPLIRTVPRELDEWPTFSLAEAMIQIMNVCGITTWGQTGYKVMDHAKALIVDRKNAPRTEPKARKATRRKA